MNNPSVDETALFLSATQVDPLWPAFCFSMYVQTENRPSAPWIENLQVGLLSRIDPYWTMKFSDHGSTMQA